MKRNLTLDEETLAAYLRGDVDAETAAAVEAWYAASEANRRKLGEIYYILFLNDRVNDAHRIDTEAALRSVRNRIRRPQRLRMRRIVVRACAAAAAVAVLVTGGLTTVSLSERLSRPVTIYTQLGERSQVVLPDGTKVWLNSNSRVEYVAPFFSRQRRVAMEGEAYFEVAHDEHAPFVVTTGGLDVRVLGTRFNIRNDEERHRVTTVLLEGAVAAHAHDNESSSVRLRPAQRLVFDSSTGAMSLEECKAADRSIRWIEGRFSFEHNTFGQIVAELERYYNVNVRFMDDRLREECFSGDFHVEDGIYHIMSVLQLTYKFTYRTAGNVIEIYPAPGR